jgi:hypothetical protein
MQAQKQQTAARQISDLARRRAIYALHNEQTIDPDFDDLTEVRRYELPETVLEGVYR